MRIVGILRAASSPNTAKQGFLADHNTRTWFANGSKKTGEKWFQDKLILAEIFWNDKDVHLSWSSSLSFPSVKVSAVSIQFSASSRPGPP